MKKKFTILMSTLLIVLPLSTYAVSGKSGGLSDDSLNNVRFEGENINDEGELEAKFEVKSKDDLQDVSGSDSEEDLNDDKGGQGEEHRSEVANFVQALLNVAEKNGRLGDEIRKIAEEQKNSSDDVSESIKKVENRGKFKTFLIGTDYKNIGAIRSELVKTQARIEALKREADKLIPIEKAEIEKEISKMEDEQAKLESFVKDNEGQFSLFGWLVKLF